MPRYGLLPPSLKVLRRTSRFACNDGSLFGRTASIRPNLFQYATAMRSRLKLWNDSGTKRARIGDSPRDPIRSPQHLALTPSGDTRSSLQGLHKRWCQGGILKKRENAESNQKWSRVNMIHAGCTEYRRSLGISLSPCGRREEPHCVFATLGGNADVTNDVASSIAWPNGVGMLMRNGTRTRVPAIGTNVISIRRSVARYLITGRSGI